CADVIRARRTVNTGVNFAVRAAHVSERRTGSVRLRSVVLQAHFRFTLRLQHHHHQISTVSSGQSLPCPLVCLYRVLWSVSTLSSGLSLPCPLVSLYLVLWSVSTLSSGLSLPCPLVSLQCSPGIMELLNVAKSSVPPSMWTRTPVVLKATAGLRLLPGEKANQLLDQVRALFQESPFLSAEDSVSIMDGTDEGNMVHMRPTGVGILDLGGGSTQITFSPRDEKTIQMSLVDDIRTFRMFNRTHTVYTHSYLGLGLMSARLAVLRAVGGSTELVSPCLPPGFSGRWEHANAVYALKGQKPGEPVYEACRNKVQKVLYRKLSRTSEAPDVDFYAFSYYYERAADLGVIGEKEGGTIRVSDYMQAAEKGETPQKSPFLCLDLVYISVLLQELGFPPHKQLRLARTIGRVETSWALGATFQHLEALGRQ
uniref:Ectonucleoside triphosphate diphosphohydrolase 6 n=1 Tax=Cyprinodon variegatus TaxID=28743 RepID=A0A3Q2DQE5_CYPVA